MLPWQRHSQEVVEPADGVGYYHILAGPVVKRHATEALKLQGPPLPLRTFRVLVSHQVSQAPMVSVHIELRPL